MSRVVRSEHINLSIGQASAPKPDNFFSNSKLEGSMCQVAEISCFKSGIGLHFIGHMGSTSLLNFSDPEVAY